MKLALVVFVASMLVLKAFGQEATRQDFNEFVKANKGRWLGQITFVTDWPGVGKKGDKVTAHSEVSIIEDGNAIFSRGFMGNGSSSSIVVYNANSKKILQQGTASGGTVFSTVWSKVGDKWVGVRSGSLPDGRKVEGTIISTFTDKDTTLTVTGSMTIDGKKTDEMHDVWHRVSN